MEHLDSVERQNTCIDVWVKRILRECHHIRTTFHVEPVLFPTEVVGSIVHRHCVLLLEAIARDEKFVAVILCEDGRFLLILTVEDTSEEMILEVENKVL